MYIELYSYIRVRIDMYMCIYMFAFVSYLFSCSSGCLKLAMELFEADKMTEPRWLGKLKDGLKVKAKGPEISVCGTC